MNTEWCKCKDTTCKPDNYCDNISADFACYSDCAKLDGSVATDSYCKCNATFCIATDKCFSTKDLNKCQKATCDDNCDTCYRSTEGCTTCKKDFDLDTGKCYAKYTGLCSTTCESC
jgi:hypothetical protein